MRASEKTRRLTGLALFTAIIVLLTVFCTFVKFGPFNITLAMVPIVVGAAIYGPRAGACLGGVFGIVVFLTCVAGADPGGAILFTARPFVTAVVCIAKGALAGLAAGAVYADLSKKSELGAVILAAVVSPVVNTGIFILGLALFYPETLTAWAGGSSVVYYVITGLVGLNFLMELAVDVVLIPVVDRILAAAGVVRQQRAAQNL